MTSCTTPISDGMKIESNTEEINDLRKAIIELLLWKATISAPPAKKRKL
jgi:NADH dehydrogenase/NADH:ubiquinone oxidoreductase subunit G